MIRAGRHTVPALLLLAFACVAADAQVRPPQSASPSIGQANSQRAEDEESESDDESVPATRPRATDPATVLRAARSVYVNSKTVFVKQTEVEDSLRKRKEFTAWGMFVTRNESEADLIIEIERKSLTRRFTFTVLDPRTMNVLTSGKTRSVLFGKKIPNKIAEKFTNRVKTVRPYPPFSTNP